MLQIRVSADRGSCSEVQAAAAADVLLHPGSFMSSGSVGQQVRVLISGGRMDQ